MGCSWRISYLREVLNLPVLGGTTALSLQAAEVWGEAVVETKGCPVPFLAAVCARSAGRAAAPCAHCVLPVQIKRRASEALPELLRPVTPITNLEGTLPQDPSGIFGLVSNLEQLDVDDWEF